MPSMNEQILRATKEIVVKFIETGRVSPAGFHDVFKTIYQTIDETVNNKPPPEPVENGTDPDPS